MANVARNMPVFERFLEVDWDATYADGPVFATGSCLYFDYDNGGVDESSSGSSLLWNVPRFIVVTPSTLQDCETDVQRLLE